MTKQYPTLYKKSSKGVLQEWTLFLDGNKFWSEYGQIGGTIRGDKPKECKGKNIGRANETTPEQQAESEADAKWKKQIEIKGYVEDRADVDKFVFWPTLAHSFDKHGHKLPENVIGSPKLDGVRAFIDNTGAYSRNRKQWASTKFLEKTLSPVLQAGNVVVDGELYCHKFKDDFNKIISLARRMKNFTDAHWEDIERHLEFHVFDVYFKDTPDMPYVQRQAWIEKTFGGGRFDSVVPVESVWTKRDDFSDLFTRWTQEGYEGIMLRDPYAKYELKRSYGLQKYKEFIDEEFEVLNFLEGEGKRSGMAGKVEFRHPKIVGDTFEAGLRGNEALFTEWFKNNHKYRGAKATVRYQNLTPDGAPRFGVMVAIRDYE